MKKQFAMAILVLACAAPAQTFAQNAQGAQSKDQKPTFAGVFERSISQVEREVVAAADAMPEDRFNFAPPASMGFRDAGKAYCRRELRLRERHLG